MHEASSSWSPREEGIIAKIMSEEYSRVEAIRTMRRRKLDDLQGEIRPSRRDAMLNAPKQICQYSVCSASTAHLRARTRFCTPACKMKAQRQSRKS